MIKVKKIIDNLTFMISEAVVSENNNDASVEGESDPNAASNVDTHHLLFVRNLLKQSIKNPETVDLSAIQKAMRYIESIKITTSNLFFTQTFSLREKLRGDNQFVFPELPILNEGEEGVFGTPLPIKSCKIFIEIHAELLDIFKDNLTFEKESNPLSKEVWAYSYPKDDSNHIIDAEVATWEAAHAVLLNADQGYKKDLVRQYSILNMLGRSSSGVDSLLEYLLESSTYDREDYKAILDWLKANGGQDSNRFIDLLLNKGVFTNTIPAAQFKSKGVVQNWTLSDEGKIIFQIDLLLQGLVMQGAVYQLNPINKQLEEVELLNDDSHNKLPVLRVKATLQLDMDKKSVQPHLTDLVVTSYTNHLSLPTPTPPTDSMKPS